MSCIRYLILMVTITIACNGSQEISKQEKSSDITEQTSTVVNNINQNCNLSKVIMTHTGTNPAYGYRSKTITNPQELIEIEKAFKNIQKGAEMEQADGGLLRVKLYDKHNNKSEYAFQKQRIVGIVENHNMYEVNIDMYNIYDKSKAEEILVDYNGDVFVFDPDVINTPDNIKR